MSPLDPFGGPDKGTRHVQDNRQHILWSRDQAERMSSTASAANSFTCCQPCTERLIMQELESCKAAGLDAKWVSHWLKQ